ncbi:MAG: hypothetical protein JST17_09035 [Bacteroidetes bacterium]|nr:hypothetical protein [Bacteroidota bacterium]MBS1932072.1 hypothetical protein [Bacteroidota bacterium]
MLKKWFLIPAFLIPCIAVLSQNTPLDSVVLSNSVKEKKPVSDTDINYDDLFRDFDDFMDSILMPHSYFLASISMGKGYFDFSSKNTAFLETTKKFTYLPALGYFHKSGFGISATGYIVNDEKNLNLYQFSVTPSYDYLENRDLATGISYTRYFTKDSLPFYTSPLQNELSAYFTYRKWWMRPAIAVNYGWGSRSAYDQRIDLIQSLRLRPYGFTYINTTETVNDFSVMASVRHDFYWLDVLAYNDHIRLTPQLVFSSGTQKFGLNQNTTTYAQAIRTGSNIIFGSENAYLDNTLYFQPLSIAFYLRGEYSIGKFFIQPQAVFDYYFPATSKNFSILGSLNVGFIF